MDKINIYFNEKKILINRDLKLINFIKTINDFDIFIINGFQLNLLELDKNRVLNENDKIVTIKKNIIPTRDEYYSLLTSRNSPDIQNKISNAIVGIAGCGGLGSNIAIAIARIGIKKLIIADYDSVEPSNLNRQQYNIDDIGKYKVDALENNIKKFNPYIEIEKHNYKVNNENLYNIYKDCSIIIEAFDRVYEKHMIISEFFNEKFKYKYLVTASGLAGFDSSNIIKTTKLSDNIYLCGDTISEAKEFNGLMSPRVMIAAGHQANMALRIIVDKLDC